MILKLRNRKIEVVSMKVPLSTERFNIMVDFEPGTQHLKPRIYIDDVEYLEGVLNKLKIKKNKRVDIRVDLSDHNNRVLHTYRANVMYYNYSLFGELPHRVDYDEYVQELENRIKTLEERGEVI